MRMLWFKTKDQIALDSQAWTLPENTREDLAGANEIVVLASGFDLTGEPTPKGVLLERILDKIAPSLDHLWDTKDQIKN